MSDLASSWQHFRLFDELAEQPSPIRRRHPVAKLLVTLAYLIAIASFGRYEVAALLPFILYPVVLLVLGDLPGGKLLQRTLLALPFAFGVGIFNPLFDRTPFVVAGFGTVAAGWLSFLSILVRAILTVLAALLLVATSGMGEVARAMRHLGLPRPFVTQTQLMYRYISVLAEETGRVLRAHSLRSRRERGLSFPVWGSLVGQLLLRSIDRAGRIYQAMLCRGFDGRVRQLRVERFRARDGLYLAGWVAFFAAARCYNLPELLGSWLMGVLR